MVHLAMSILDIALYESVLRLCILCHFSLIGSPLNTSFLHFQCITLLMEAVVVGVCVCPLIVASILT